MCVIKLIFGYDMSLVKSITVDDDVNVYVVGDIHACYTQLKDKLKEVGFNYNTDLLIAVGDLVDRGKENEKCIGLLNEHWFTTIKGNHEDFCYKGMIDYMTEFYHKMENNGGKWFYELPEDLREHIGNRLNQLPVLLEVSYRGKKFGFVHADVPVEDWDLLRELLLNDDELGGRSIKEQCLWGRNIVYKDSVEIAGVHNVFLGHTVLDEIKQVGNCTFLDTGGCFKSHDNKYDLSIVKLSNYI